MWVSNSPSIAVVPAPACLPSQKNDKSFTVVFSGPFRPMIPTHFTAMEIRFLIAIINFSCQRWETWRILELSLLQSLHLLRESASPSRERFLNHQRHPISKHFLLMGPKPANLGTIKSTSLVRLSSV